MPRFAMLLRACWTRARWALAPRPSGRQFFTLLALCTLLCLPNLRFLARPYELAMMSAWDDYWLLKGLDKGHAPADALGWFHGDWPEGNGFYRPLAGVSLWVDYLFHGWNPYPYRVTNLLLYLVSGAILGLFVSALTRRRDFAALSVALFCLCPQEGAETVLLTFNPRGDLLCALFYLSALYCALRLARYSERRFGVWFALFMVLALLSKEMALSLPLILLPTLLLASQLPPRRALRTLLTLLPVCAVILIGWYLTYRHAVPSRLPEGMPKTVASTGFMCLSAILDDLMVLLLWLKSGPVWGDLISCYVPVALMRLAVWGLGLGTLARTQWRLALHYLLWGLLTWLPLITTHIQARHYLYLPQLNRAIAGGAVVVIVLQMLGQWWGRRRGAKCAGN